MKHLPGRFLLALLPFTLGLAVYFILHILFEPVPLLVFKADIGSAAAVTGALFSLFLLSAVLGWRAAGRRAEQDIQDARQEEEDARRRFIRRLDHELKNPLTGLRAALANLHSAQQQPAPAARLDLPETERSLLAEAEHARALDDARHQTERLSRLVADLRKLADLEVRPIEVGPVDMGEVLEETIEAACGLPENHNRKVNLIIARVPWPLPPVTGDRDLLGLAFYNLVDNALKYSAPGDAVEIRAVEDGRWLAVEVADSGPGIAEEDLPRVFDELYRGTNAQGQEGSGLGLALVRRVVDRHGGEITVRSRQAGQKGTVFRVRLPVEPGGERRKDGTS